MSAISTFRLSLDEDLAFWARHDIDRVGVSVAKLEAFGWERGVELVGGAIKGGLDVANLIGLGPFHLADPRALGGAARPPRTRARRRSAPARRLPRVHDRAGGRTHRGKRPPTRSRPRWPRCSPPPPQQSVQFALEHTNSLRADVGFVHSLRDVIDLAARLGTGVCMEINACWAERDLAGTIARGRRPHRARAGERLHDRHAQHARPARARRRRHPARAHPAHRARRRVPRRVRPRVDRPAHRRRGLRRGRATRRSSGSANCSPNFGRRHLPEHPLDATGVEAGVGEQPFLAAGPRASIAARRARYRRFGSSRNHASGASAVGPTAGVVERRERRRRASRAEGTATRSSGRPPSRRPATGAASCCGSHTSTSAASTSTGHRARDVERGAQPIESAPTWPGHTNDSSVMSAPGALTSIGARSQPRRDTIVTRSSNGGAPPSHCVDEPHRRCWRHPTRGRRLRTGNDRGAGSVRRSNRPPAGATAGPSRPRRPPSHSRAARRDRPRSSAPAVRARRATPAAGARNSASIVGHAASASPSPPVDGYVARSCGSLAGERHAVQPAQQAQVVGVVEVRSSRARPSRRPLRRPVRRRRRAVRTIVRRTASPCCGTRPPGTGTAPQGSRGSSRSPADHAHMNAPPSAMNVCPVR